LERIDPVDVDALNHIGSLVDDDSADGVDLDNIERAGGSLAQLGWIFHMQEHLMPRLVVKGVRFKARTVVLLINDNLLLVLNERKISKERELQNHIAVESHHTGRSLSCVVD
jgi:hypothetical protein